MPGAMRVGVRGQQRGDPVMVKQQVKSLIITYHIKQVLFVKDLFMKFHLGCLHRFMLFLLVIHLCVTCTSHLKNKIIAELFTFLGVQTITSIQY